MQSIANGDTQYIYDYLNDLDGRQILDEVLNVADPDQKSRFLKRIEVADQLFLSLAIPTMECIWGSKNAIKHGWTREKHWWYFHRPINVDDDEWPG